MSERPPLSPREHLSALVLLAPRALRAAWLGGVVLAVGLAVTTAWTLATPRLYRSEAVLSHERGVRPGSLGGGEGESPHEIAVRLHDMLTSRQRLEHTIKEMKLYPKIIERRGVSEAIEEMGRHLNIAGRDGYSYRVSYDAPGRELAQSVLSSLIKDLIEEDSQRRIREAEATKVFIDAERKSADDDLKTKEAALASFLTKHPQLANEAGGSGASAGGLLRAADRDRGASVSGDTAGLELQAAQLEESLAALGVRPAPAPGEPAAVVVDPVLAAARSRAHTDLQAAQHDLIEKQARFTNEHPDVKASLQHVAQAEAALRRADAALEAARAAAAANGPAPSAAPAGGGDDGANSGRATALRHALSAVHSQIAAMRSRGGPRVEVPRTTSTVVAIDTDWTRLNRDVSAARAQQAQLEAKQFQAQLMATLADGGLSDRLVVLDPPYRPLNPVAGGRFKIALTGAAVAVMLSLLAIALLAAFDDRLYDTRDIERVVPNSIVIVIPRLTGKSG